MNREIWAEVFRFFLASVKHSLQLDLFEVGLMIFLSDMMGHRMSLEHSKTERQSDQNISSCLACINKEKLCYLGPELPNMMAKDPQPSLLINCFKATSRAKNKRTKTKEKGYLLFLKTFIYFHFMIYDYISLELTCDCKLPHGCWEPNFNPL